MVKGNKLINENGIIKDRMLMGKNEMKMRENNERNRRKGVNIQKK